MLKMKRLLPLLFSLVLLFCSALPVQAAEFESYTVSGGDLVLQTDFGIMLLSEDYGVSPAASVLPYAIPSGLKTITYWPSYTTSHEVVEISLTKFKLGDYTSDWVSNNRFILYGSINIQNIVGMNPYMARLWIRCNGQKHELINNYNWYSFTLPNCFDDDDMEMGIDIYFNNRFNSDSDRPFSEYSRPDLTEDNLTVVWEAFSFSLDYKPSDLVGSIDNVHSSIESGNYWLQSLYGLLDSSFQSIYNKIEDVCISLWNKIDEFRIQTFDNFATLFEKMDEDQEDLINGYDPGTGSAAKNEFDSSAAQLEAAEGNLFGQTSYDQVDYQQFNSFFSIEAVAASMLFVKAILESLYGALGVFGVPLTIGLVLLVFTRIIGFQNFYSGGD